MMSWVIAIDSDRTRCFISTSFVLCLGGKLILRHQLSKYVLHQSGLKMGKSTITYLYLNDLNQQFLNFLLHSPDSSGTLLRNDLQNVYISFWVLIRQTVLRLPKNCTFIPTYSNPLCYSSSRWLLLCCCFSRVSIAFTISCQVLFTSLLRDQKKRKALCRVNVETAKDDNLILVHRN